MSPASSHDDGFPDEENLAMRFGIRVSVAVQQGSGGGAADPSVLLNEAAHRLDGRSLAEFDQSNTYDTFDGRNSAAGPDWYGLEFPQPVTHGSLISPLVRNIYAEHTVHPAADVHESNIEDQKTLPQECILQMINRHPQRQIYILCRQRGDV